MTNRWRLLNPFDVVVDPVDGIFRYALSHEQWQAWKLLEDTLEGFKKAIRSDTQFDIVKPDTFRIRVPLGERKVPNIIVQWRYLPGELQQALHNWAIRETSYKQEFELVTERVRGLLRSCTTPGQIERVWPELLGFMPTETVDQRLDKKMKSPIPNALLDWEDGPDRNENYGRIQVEYKPEVLGCFNDSLAAALVLPLGGEGVKLYPSVTLLD